MTDNLRTFRVSLACLIPFNFECEVKAQNDLEAFEKGRELFYEGEEGEFEEMVPAEATLDLSDNDSEGEIPTGAYIEEIK